VQDTDPTPATSQVDTLAAWMRLEQTPGVGPVTAQRLLARFLTPQAIFSASHDALAFVVSDAIAKALSAPPTPAVGATIDAALTWLQSSSHHLLTWDHPAYPALLREIADPPLVLYAIGRIELLAGPALAMVGSRNASLQGRSTAASFAQALSGAGMTIVSGLALGIDAAAHEGGLRGPGSTVAVIGTGADRIYPRRNGDLAHRIAAEGCVISEYSLGVRPLAANFPKRNRIISGLSCAVLVVEAAAESGSLITAQVAVEQGRDVFAIPGSIHSPLSKGCHKLIQQGAKLVQTVDDVLGELCAAPLVTSAIAAEPAYTGEHGALLDTLGHGPIHSDALVAATAIAPGLLSAQLLTLELAGLVERLPGGLFQRINR
jgi:DNA processing protein